MDVEYALHGVRFRWNQEKAAANIAKHGISFERACQIFFDPFVRYQDASDKGETRAAALGADFEYRVFRCPHGGRGRPHSYHLRQESGDD